MSEIFFSPAKVNLRLKVVGKREDGYHLLEMINVSVSFGDEVALELNEEGRFTIEVESEPSFFGDLESLNNPDNNLAIRAAKQFFSDHQLDYGISIKLRKRIPIGAGLAGGSSNGAVVLKYLGERFGKDVEELALSLGADIPFLLDGRPSKVTGIGEVIEPLESSGVRGVGIALILFPFGCNTGEIFRRLAESESEVDQVENQEVRIGEMALSLSNDFESVVSKLHPEVGETLRFLREEEGVLAGLSGTGSTVFALSSSEDRLEVGSSIPALSAQFLKVVEGFGGVVVSGEIL